MPDPHAHRPTQDRLPCQHAYPDLLPRSGAGLTRPVQHPVWVIKRRCSMQQGPTIRIGLVAEIADYQVTIVGDSVTVAYRDEARIGQVVTTQEVHHLARFIRRARDLRVILAAFPAFEVVYLFDLAQDGYGYAVNLQVPPFSEWGYAPLNGWHDAGRQ